jgi:hypothetical protein
MSNLTLLAAIRLINKMVKVSVVHVHVVQNGKEVALHSLKMDELR